MLRSLALQTDLFFTHFEGEVIDKKDYLVVLTPKNPSYHWGNYLIFKEAPKQGDFDLWQAIFQDEVLKRLPEVSHQLFAWDDPLGSEGEVADFLAGGFRLEHSLALSTQQPIPPVKPNHDISCRPLNSDADWQQAFENQVACRDLSYEEVGYRLFKERQMKRYRDMAEAGLGSWYGAFLGKCLVADLGIFVGPSSAGSLARYQSVGTHPHYRRQGICGTLVYQSAQLAQQQNEIKRFVMVADEHYHAARIYESVGFKVFEKLKNLYLYQCLKQRLSSKG
ncbi:MAG: GNAT family N-acetyltransferase [Deinococcales bacterium]